MTILEKRSWDERVFEIDCSALIPEGESIASVLELLAEPTTATPIEFGAAVTNSEPVEYEDASASSGTRTAPAGTVVQVLISGGETPAPVGTVYQQQAYLVRARLLLSSGEKVEATIKLVVRDAP